MAELLGQAVLELVTDDSALQAGIKRGRAAANTLGKDLEKFGKKAKSIGQSMTLAFTAPLAGLGVLASKTTLQYESGLTKITSLVGIARDEVDGWRGDLERIAAETGKPLNELAQGLFFVTSAGLRGSAAIDTLEASAKAAAAGLGETETVADAVTSALNAYGPAALSAEQATGILVATVREGKASADSIASALGQVLPLASELGVSFDQVGASVAAMTRLGNSASESVTSLRGIFNALLKPTSDAEKAMAEYGLSSQALRQQLREEGLIAVLGTLKDRVGDNQAAMARLFPDVQGLVGVLNLAGQNAEAARGIFAALAKETGGALNAAFATTAEDGAFKLAQEQAKLNTSLVQLGTAVLPVAIPLIQQLVGLVTDAATWFSALSPETQEWLVIAGGIAAVVGPALVVLGTLATSIGALIPVLTGVGGAMLSTFVAATGPVGLAIIAAAAITAAWAAWGDDITAIVRKTVGFIRKWLQEKLGAIFDFVGEKIDEVVGFFAEMYDKVVGNSFVPDMVDAIGVEFGRLDELMTRPAGEAVEKVTDAFDDMQAEVGGFLDRMMGDLERGELSWRSFASAAIDSLRAVLEAQLGASKSGGILGEVLGAGLNYGISLLGGGGGALQNTTLDLSDMGSFAEGGRPPTGRPSLVGEMGPEIFVPDTAGSIIPNDQLRGLGQGQGGGPEVFIDARGADEAGLAQVANAVRALDGSIERRAVGAVVEARSRNPALFAAGRG